MKDLSIIQKSYVLIRLNEDVSHVQAETIESALSPVGASAARLISVEELSDSDLLAATDLRMDEAQGRQLGRLLDRQQAGKLSAAERNELTAEMQVYHECLVRKAEALGEAVRRGLREPLTS